jgi:hypothetical protein
MALASNPLYTSNSRGPLPSLIPQNRQDAVRTVTFAAAAVGAETLPIGTPVFVDSATGFVKKIVPGSVTAQETEVWGFVYPAAVAIKASGGGEVLGTVMIFGEATYADILALQTAGVLAGSEANLKTALRKGIARQRGFTINGLDLLGGP